VVACVREEDKEKEKEARKLYEGFVRRKDETRIRLPTNLAPDAKVTKEKTWEKTLLLFVLDFLLET
jgi:hypothetical protein